MAVKKEAVEEKKMYSIRLFRDSNKYKDDVFVAVNGKGYLVKRGQTVEVPEEVYEVLMHSLDQDEYTAQLIEEKKAEFERESHALGI